MGGTGCDRKPAAVRNQPESGWEGIGAGGDEGVGAREGGPGLPPSPLLWSACPSPSPSPLWTGRAGGQADTLAGWLLGEGLWEGKRGERTRERERERGLGGHCSVGFWPAGSCRFRGGRPSWEISSRSVRRSASYRRWLVSPMEPCMRRPKHHQKATSAPSRAMNPLNMKRGFGRDSGTTTHRTRQKSRGNDAESCTIPDCHGFTT